MLKKTILSVLLLSVLAVGVSQLVSASAVSSNCSFCFDQWIDCMNNGFGSLCDKYLDRCLSRC